MTTTGWPIITSSIAGLPMILANTTSPTTGQVLGYDGTKITNQTTTANLITTLTNAAISTTANAVATITVANTPVAFTNTSGTATLAAGTYIMFFYGFCTASNTNTGTIELVRTAGTGTCTSVGRGHAVNGPAPLVGTRSISGAGLTSIALVTMPNTASTYQVQTQGVLVITASMTLTLEGVSTVGATTLTLPVGCFVRFTKVA